MEQLPHSRLNGASIKEIAVKFYNLLDIPEDERLELTNGWLYSFQKRHGLKLFQFHGEAASAPIEILAPERDRLLKELYDLRVEMSKLRIKAVEIGRSFGSNHHR